MRCSYSPRFIFALSMVKYKRIGKPQDLPAYKQVYLPYDTEPTARELDSERRQFLHALVDREEQQRKAEVKNVPANMFSYGKEGMSIPISIFKDQSDPVIGPEWTYPGIYENMIVCKPYYLQELFKMEEKNEWPSPWLQQKLSSHVRRRANRVRSRMALLNLRESVPFQKERGSGQKRGGPES